MQSLSTLPVRSVRYRHRAMWVAILFAFVTLVVEVAAAVIEWQRPAGPAIGAGGWTIHDVRLWSSPTGEVLWHHSFRGWLSSTAEFSRFSELGPEWRTHFGVTERAPPTEMRWLLARQSGHGEKVGWIQGTGWLFRSVVRFRCDDPVILPGAAAAGAAVDFEWRWILGAALLNGGAATVIILIVVTICSVVRQVYRRSSGRCLFCGYLLRIPPGVGGDRCPECGEQFVLGSPAAFECT